MHILNLNSRLYPRIFETLGIVTSYIENKVDRIPWPPPSLPSDLTVLLSLLFPAMPELFC